VRSVNRLNDLMLDRSGLLWVASQSGASLLDLRAKRFHHVIPGNAAAGHLSDPTVWSICEDRRGDVWVATESGLNRIRAGVDSVQVYRHDPADSASVCADALSCVLEDGTGRLWVASDRGGLGYYDPAGDAFVNYRAGPAAPSGRARVVLLRTSLPPCFSVIAMPIVRPRFSKYGTSRAS